MSTPLLAECFKQVSNDLTFFFKSSTPPRTAKRCWQRARPTCKRRRYATLYICVCIIVFLTMSLAGRCYLSGGESISLRVISSPLPTCTITYDVTPPPHPHVINNYFHIPFTCLQYPCYLPVISIAARPFSLKKKFSLSSIDFYRLTHLGLFSTMLVDPYCDIDHGARFLCKYY